MSQQVHLKLLESEKAVFRAACDIYAGYVAAGMVEIQSDKEKELMERAIVTAISMAKRVDKLVQSDSEMPGLS